MHLGVHHDCVLLVNSILSLFGPIPITCVQVIQWASSHLGWDVYKVVVHLPSSSYRSHFLKAARLSPTSSATSTSPTTTRNLVKMRSRSLQTSKTKTSKTKTSKTKMSTTKTSKRKRLVQRKPRRRPIGSEVGTTTTKTTRASLVVSQLFATRCSA